jgi:hypothetical protein
VVKFKLRPLYPQGKRPPYPLDLSWKEPPAPTGQEVGRTPAPIWTRWWREKIPPLPCRDSNPGHPARTVITILTELFLFMYIYIWGHTRTVCIVRGLTLLLRVGTLWRCSDGLFFEVPPFTSDAPPAKLHPLLENVLQTVDYFEISCLGTPFPWLEKPKNRMGRARSGLYGGCSNGVPPIHFLQAENRFNSDSGLRFLGFSNHENGAPRQEISKRSTVCSTF